MEIKNVKISEEHHKKLVELCHLFGSKQKDFLESCIDIFHKSKENPKSNYTNQALRNTFISFIREQEKTYLKPIKNDFGLVQNDLKEIKSNIEFLFNKIK